MKKLKLASILIILFTVVFTSIKVLAIEQEKIIFYN